MSKYSIRGIDKPGRINLKLNGRFVDVELYSAPDDILEALYNSGCEYVTLSPSEYLKRNPDIANINVQPIKINRNKKQHP